MNADDVPPSGSSQDDSSSQNANGMQAFETLSRFLDEDGWYPNRIEGRYAFSAHYTGENGDVRCYASIRVDLEQFVFYAVAPVKVPDVVRPAVGEFLTRANYGIRLGNFEMDYSDGEVRYKNGLNFSDEALTANMIRNTIYPAIKTMDKYMLGLLRVIYGGATPLESIEEIENPPAA